MLLSQLKYFQVVAEHEHISHAAEELHVAQPALSTTISKIEKELGVPLFNRQGRNIELNDAGHRLFLHTNFIFDQIDEMKQSLIKTQEILENRFVLSVSNSMFLNGWLQEFVLQNPQIRLQQKMLSEEQMVEALLDESIDVALGEFDEDMPGIVRQTIIEDEYVVDMNPQHPLTKKDILCFEDIRNENIIALPSNTIFKIADRLFAQRDCSPNVVFEGNHRMMEKMVRLNRGILFGSRQMFYMPYYNAKKHGVDTESLDEQLSAVRAITDLDCHCSLSLCWKENRELPIMAQRFVDAMKNDYPNYKNDAEYLSKSEYTVPVF